MLKSDQNLTCFWLFSQKWEMIGTKKKILSYTFGLYIYCENFSQILKTDKKLYALKVAFFLAKTKTASDLLKDL